MPGESWFDGRGVFDGDRNGEWGLDGCCGVEENLFLTFYVVYAAVFFFLHRCPCLKPVRLLTVFLHEFSHATGTLLFWWWCRCPPKQDSIVIVAALVAKSHPSVTFYANLACWITGGSVRKIEVYENEGGVTGYTGGCRLLVRGGRTIAMMGDALPSRFVPDYLAT